MGDKLESHHIPSSQSLEKTGIFERNDGPAIQMSPEDHKNTQSWGPSRYADRYRTMQEKLIRDGRFMDAFEKDIDDIRRVAREAGDPSRYEEAIKEAKEYAECVEKHKLRS